MSNGIRCQKCGYIGGYMFRGHYQCPPPPPTPHHGVRYCAGCHLQEGEHLHRICPNCGYVWVEQCAQPEPLQPKKPLPPDHVVGHGSFLQGALIGAAPGVALLAGILAWVVTR